jgi:hypothetical protein
MPDLPNPPALGYTTYPNAVNWMPQLAQNTNPPPGTATYPNAVLWLPQTAQTTNIQPGDILLRAAGVAANSLSSLSGIPQVAQIGQSMLNASDNYSIYNQYQVADAGNNKPIFGVKYPDFRSRKGYRTNPVGTRLDGLGAALRGSIKAGIYAAATASPLGAYSIFNLDGVGKTGYGWGDHDNPYALKTDFTARSHVATRWKPSIIYLTDASGKKTGKQQLVGEWAPTINPLEMATPFRGDKVTVIDFGKRKLAEAYLWRPNRLLDTKKFLGAQLNKLGITQDFIKFYLTGPKLQAGNDIDEDDIIVFRAIIGAISDTFQPSWTAQQMIGRADSNYHYTGVTRDLQIDFTVYATDRDELKPIWRKLNALAGYTAPEYDPESIAMIAPFMRITIGDLFVQQAVIITSLGFTLHDSDTNWEINIENDKTMMQVPHKVSVSLGLTPIMDQLPQKGGRFYTLAKDFDSTGQPRPGNDDWLSDTKTNPDINIAADLADRASKRTIRDAERTNPDIDKAKTSTKTDTDVDKTKTSTQTITDKIKNRPR